MTYTEPVDYYDPSQLTPPPRQRRRGPLLAGFVATALLAGCAAIGSSAQSQDAAQPQASYEYAQYHPEEATDLEAAALAAEEARLAEIAAQQADEEARLAEEAAVAQAAEEARLAEQAAAAEHAAQEAAASQRGFEVATVQRTIDGDTIVVTVGGVTERVRFIGIDAPEIGQAGADAATNFVRDRIATNGNRVYLQRQGDNRDRFDRLRRNVWLGVPSDPDASAERDSLLLGRMLINAGLATLWTPSTPAATAAPAAPTASGTPFANCTAVWNAIGRPIRAGEPGFHSRLDRDNDGIGCERDPR